MFHIDWYLFVFIIHVFFLHVRIILHLTDTGLTEECPTILETASESLSLLAEEMPAHYSFLIPALESIYNGDILNYPIEADTKLFNAIGKYFI